MATTCATCGVAFRTAMLQSHNADGLVITEETIIEPMMILSGGRKVHPKIACTGV